MAWSHKAFGYISKYFLEVPVVTADIEEIIKELQMKASRYLLNLFALFGLRWKVGEKGLI